jgi:putative Ca2+/H+ antiporter (TMEM165/GDT1 family)
MEWKLFTSTFVVVFIAELGDKTQLATLSLAAGGSSRWIVFLGSALALVASAAIAVIVGAALVKVIPPIWLKRGAGAIFIVLGVLYLFERPDKPAEAHAAPAPAESSTGTAAGHNEAPPPEEAELQ